MYTVPIYCDGVLLGEVTILHTGSIVGDLPPTQAMRDVIGLLLEGPYNSFNLTLSKRH